jgi:hypothetical protein
MSPSSVCRLAFVSAALQTFALAQTPVPPSPPPPPMRWSNLPQPPVPTDPLELVTGNAGSATKLLVWPGEA